MSIDQLAFILENCHAAKYEDWKAARLVVVKFQLHEGDDWQQIEIDKAVFRTLQNRYRTIVDKWIGEKAE